MKNAPVWIMEEDYGSQSIQLRWGTKLGPEGGIKLGDDGPGKN